MAETPMNGNYPSNSHKAREAKPVERPKVVKIVEGTASKRKKPFSRKIAETFTGDDAQSVGQYVLFDIVIPAIKSLVLDTVSQGLERSLYGDSRGRIRLGSGSSSRTYTNYNRVSSNPASNGRESRDSRDISRRARVNHDFDEVVLDSRGEAEEVLDALGNLVDQFDWATVSDLYELVGITPTGFTDEKWGWDDLRGADISRTRDGYVLNMPKPKPID